MKKFLAMMLSILMTFSGASLAYAAETLDIDCVVSNGSLEIGDTFYVDFKINDNTTGYNSITAYLRYDPSVIRAIECDVDDIPNDLIVTQNDSGAYLSLFSFTYVNGRINFKPKSGDRDYDGYADGRKTASEIGIIKLTNYLGTSVNSFLQNYDGTGTLVRMKFEAVGGGSTDIVLDNAIAAYFVEGQSMDLNVNAYSGSVYVAGDPYDDGNDSTETTTIAAPTETTTTNSTSSDSSSGSSSGSSSSGSSSSGGGSFSGSSSSSAEVNQNTNDKPDEADTSIIGGADSATDINIEVSFVDVKPDAWYYEPIMKLASAKIVNGYAVDNTFRPNNNVTRADFLLMLLRGMGIDTTAVPKSNFGDVAQGKYYYNAVGIAKEMGIASGDGANFNPENNITRQDMMILAKKALENVSGAVITGDVSVLDKFNDKNDISAYALDSLAAMVSEGIVNGMGEGIAPKANTTRAQAVVIISNIMNKLAQ